MPEERLRSVGSPSRLVPDDVAHHTFGSVRRGFDPSEVRAYLESIAVALRGMADREEELHREIADAEHRAANPVLDEGALATALGAETARVLRSAQEAAAEIVGNAETEATRLRTESESEAEQRRTDTETRLAQQRAAAEALAKDLLDKADQQATAALEKAQSGSAELLEETRQQCRAMVDEAQGLRGRVLADLANRRKVLHAQIDQLRAGRERLAETVHDVRRSIDTIAEDLFAAEDNARRAAEEAARHAAERPEEGTPEEVAASLLAEEGSTEHSDVEDPSQPDGGAEGELAAPDQSEADQSADGDAAPDDSPVDALFAKLRASQDEPADAQAADAEPADADADADTAGADAGVETAAANDETTAEARPPTAEEDAEDADAGPPDERNPAAVRRDELIQPIVTSLARRLKRTLQDSQNELLDSLRSGGFNWSAELLPDEKEHVDGYATAALPALEQAAVAGAVFAGVEGAGGPKTDELVGIAHELAEAVVGPLRRRLSDEREGLADADEAVVSDHVGSAFREWKGERIERLAGDHVVAAFSAGTLAVLTEADKAEFEWVAVAGFGDAPCPDCEDNGLSGPQQPGAEFPTGHGHPPAHPGCRCLLTRATT
jgi:DivIVA domain-containing protein